MQSNLSLNQLIFMITLMLLTSGCKQSHDTFSSKLKSDSGLSKLQASIAPVFVTLENDPGEQLKLPSFDISNPLFGSFDIGNSDDPTISVAIDSVQGNEVVYIDLNNDNDLTNDVIFSWKGQYEGKGAALKMPEIDITINYSVIQSNRPKEVTAHLSLRRYNADEATKVSNLRLIADQVILITQNSYRIGEISLDGNKYKIAIVDHFGNGLFDDSTDVIIIDIDGDDKLDGNIESPEYYTLSESFNIGGATYEVASISPSGDFVEIKKSEITVPAKKSLNIGDSAPIFSVKDINDNEISLDDFRGKVLLLDFWATWCSPCVAEIPRLKELYNNYHHQGFEILGIDYDANITKLRDFLTKEQIPWPQIHDYKQGEKTMSNVIGGKISEMYRVFGLPTYYLVGKDGKILAKNLRREKLIEALQKSLN